MSAGVAKSVDLATVLAGARLPALPHSAIKVMSLAGDPKNGPAELALPIEADPGLTGQVLRFLNSSYFGFSSEIASVKLAITMVGVQTIKNFVLWSAIFSLIPNPRCGPFVLKTLWQDSLRRGLFARSLAKLLRRKEAEDVFAAALLQDMAVPLLAKALPGEYFELLKLRGDGRRRLSTLEREVFGWTHAQAATVMARQWKLPAELTRLIEGHTNLSPAGDSEARDLQMMISLSALLPSVTDQAWFEYGTFAQSFQRFARPGWPSVDALLDGADQEFAVIAPLLQLSGQSRTLGDYYREAKLALR